MQTPATLYIAKEKSTSHQNFPEPYYGSSDGGKTGEEISLPPVDLVESNVSAYVALRGVSVNIADVYDTDLFDFTGPKVFDQVTGYHSTSMLSMPHAQL